MVGASSLTCPAHMCRLLEAWLPSLASASAIPLGCCRGTKTAPSRSHPHLPPGVPPLSLRSREKHVPAERTCPFLATPFILYVVGLCSPPHPPTIYLGVLGGGVLEGPSHHQSRASLLPKSFVFFTDPKPPPLPPRELLSPAVPDYGEEWA